MERHPFARPLFSLLVLAALILLLSACGRTAAFDELTEQEEQTVEQTEPAPNPGDGDADQPGDGDAGQPGDGDADDATGPAPDVDLTYGEEPRVNGELVDQVKLDEMDLDGAILTGDFSGFDFTGRNLGNAVLNGAKFENAKFVNAKFSGARFWYGWFVGADFTGAELQGADLSYGNFTRAIFKNAKMPGASFKMVMAILDNALWTDGETTCEEGSRGSCN
jgi:hypothetical protein